MRYLYPQGKKKALTFSYDDGQIYDRRLTEIFRAYGLKGTFHLNSGRLLGQSDGQLVPASELAQVYAGQEIACHGLGHRDLTALGERQVCFEVGEDRRNLERLCGAPVQGMSYPFGHYKREYAQLLHALGIKYARTVKASGNFFPPADFYEWNPTCHHDDRLEELGERFLNVGSFYELPLMYVWGHSFEFGRKGDFGVIERFAEKMSGRQEIWYATNLELCNYFQTIRRLEFSADGERVYNPSAQSVWAELDGTVTEIGAGAVQQCSL